MSRTVISKQQWYGLSLHSQRIQSVTPVKHLIPSISAAALSLVSLSLASCAGPEPTSKTGADAPIQSRQVIGDWNDLQPAADLGASRGRVAPLNESTGTIEDGRKTMTFTFLASDDRQFVLIATQTTRGSGETAPGPIDLLVRGNPYRDAARERAILDGAASRLKQLAGKDWAPIR